MSRPILATTDPLALTQNLAVVRRRAPTARIWAVVKANAYGHGLDAAVPALAGADGMALLDLDEARRARALGWHGPVLLLEGFFDAADLAEIDRLRLATTIHNETQLQQLAAARLAAPVDVCLKLNSGMNRLGFTVERYRSAWQRLRALPQVGRITLMMHFSDADGPRGIAHQLAAFERAAGDLPGPRSFANSAAVLWHPSAHLDWVRPGIMLYGASPTGRAADLAGTGLVAAQTLSSQIIAVQQLAAGDTVGYGSRFVAPAPMTIGVVACGYADGYPRCAPDGTPVVVAGVKSRLLGRVSMDMLTVDLTPCPAAAIGTPVELWGRQLPIDDVAAACGTIGYELMCAVAARVPRAVAPWSG